MLQRASQSIRDDFDESIMGPEESASGNPLADWSSSSRVRERDEGFAKQIRRLRFLIRTWLSTKRGWATLITLFLTVSLIVPLSVHFRRENNYNGNKKSESFESANESLSVQKIDLENVFLGLNEFSILSDEERQRMLRKIRNGSLFLNPNKTIMHGKVGLKDDGTDFFVPGPPPPKDMDMKKELRRGGGFNLKLSDSLPLDRFVEDSRDPTCRVIEYSEDSLPDSSVIIVFYNEPFSTLMRSVHSVLNYTPPKLLREIILVDDGSDLGWIRKGSGYLDEYASLLPKTRVVRNNMRKGIVGARMAGIRAAQAPMFVILDSHIEVQPGWLEPLAQRIGENATRIVMPSVDGTEQETLVNKPGGIGCTLGFLWKLIEHSFDGNESPVPSRQNSKPTDFVTSPTMAGGLFAANTEFFMKIGGYDELFQYWGTENLELSFRLWTCGGSLECSQCSRVYHIFRKGGVGYSSPPYSTTKNKMRTLTIWMDEYADLAWRVMGKPVVDFGEFESMKNFRTSNQCKSFNWFIENVNPESYIHDIPADVPYLGAIKNVQSGECLDLNDDSPGTPVKIYSCHGGNRQEFMYFTRVQHIMPVQNDETCLFAESADKADKTGWCYQNQQMWRIQEVKTAAPGETATVMLEFVSTQQCLSVREHQLTTQPCDSKNSDMLWTWPKYNPPKVFTPPPVNSRLRNRIHN